MKFIEYLFNPISSKDYAPQKDNNGGKKRKTKPNITGIKISGNLSNKDAKREYQRRYYQLHKEKQKEYQRQYNLTHKKKARIGHGKNSDAPREVIRTTFHINDLMYSPVEKTIRMLEQIINGERFFTKPSRPKNLNTS